MMQVGYTCCMILVFNEAREGGGPGGVANRNEKRTIFDYGVGIYRTWRCRSIAIDVEKLP